MEVHQKEKTMSFLAIRRVGLGKIQAEDQGEVMINQLVIKKVDNQGELKEMAKKVAIPNPVDDSMAIATIVKRRDIWRDSVCQRSI